MASSNQFIRPNLGPPNPRVAATLTLIGVLICALAALLVTPRAATRAAAAAPSNRLVEAPPRLVKVIEGTERSDPCGERTWPYFDARCPARANAAAPQAALSPAAFSPPPAVPAAVIAPPLQPAKTPATTRAAAPTTVGIAPRVEDAAQAQDDADALVQDPYEQPVKPPKPRGGRQHIGIFGIRF